MNTKDPFEVYHEWCSHLGDPKHDSVSLYKPFAPWRIEELALMRRVNRELAEKRAADLAAAEEARARQEAEEALAAEAKTDGTEVTPDAGEEAPPDEEEDDVPHAARPPGPAAHAKQAQLFVPTKRNADNSLFTKYG